MIRWVFRPLTQLWASICTSERPSDLHLIFTRLHPRRVKIIIFRVVSELISLRSFKKIRTGTICQGSSPLLSYLLSLRIIGFSTTILSTLMHSLIRVSRRDIWRVRLIRAGGLWWLKRLTEPVTKAQFLVPQPEPRKRAPAPHLKSALFLVEPMQLQQGCIRTKLGSTIPCLSPHQLLPLIKKPTVNREPLSSQAAKLFPRYNFRYF